MITLNFDYLKSIIKPRPYNAHKGSMGCLFSVCGSYGMAGAEFLSGKAALRSGVGLLKMAVTKSVYPIIAMSLPEAVYLPMEDIDGRFSATNISNIIKTANSSNAVLVGCGLGVSDDTEKIVNAIVKETEKPVLIDADGINCISKHINLLSERKHPTILTPHPKEMSRLTGISVKEIQSNRQNVAETFSKKYGVITVLKGADTIITDGNTTYINYTGNPGMATGGSGDVLAGITSSLLAQGYSPTESANMGVFIHGTAGDIAKEKYSETSMLPSDIIELLPQVFSKI